MLQLSEKRLICKLYQRLYVRTIHDAVGSTLTFILNSVPFTMWWVSSKNKLSTIYRIGLKWKLNSLTRTVFCITKSYLISKEGSQITSQLPAKFSSRIRKTLYLFKPRKPGKVFLGKDWAALCDVLPLLAVPMLDVDKRKIKISHFLSHWVELR